MAITFSIPNTEVIITTGQTTVTAQALVNAIREFEDDFVMMSNSKIIDASGKFPVGAVFSEIILTLLNPWTIRFADEATAHTSITGGTFLATDAVGDARPVTTNFSLTVNQSISGTLINGDISNQIVEGTRTFQEALRLLLAAQAGNVSVAPAGPVLIKDAETGIKTRITATVDASGNRTITALDDT